MDGTVRFELPELERMRRRRDTLGMLGLTAHGGRLLHDMKRIDRSFFNEDPATWHDGERLVKYLRHASEIVTEDEDETGLEALHAQLAGRKVQIVGDTWVGNGCAEHAYTKGVIMDVYRTELPNGSIELVAAVADGAIEGEVAQYAEKPRLVVLRTVAQLMF